MNDKRTSIYDLNDAELLDELRGKKPRRNKYNAQKAEVNGITFDSKVESKRYVYLKTLENAGDISDLEIQPRFEIIPPLKTRGGAQRGAVYTADFMYTENGVQVIEDVKGQRNLKADFTLRRKLVQQAHPDALFRVVFRDRRGSWEIKEY